MTQRIVIDPITRIEGHLRIEAEVDGRQQDNRGLFVRHHGARHRDHPARPRPARSLGLCPARLRRLHHRAFVRLDPFRRRRPGHQDPQGRQPDPQPDDRAAVRARPRDALLSPARAGLGGCGVRAQGRPGRRPPRSSRPSRPGPIPRRATSPAYKEGAVHRRQRPAFDLRQCLLGPPGLQAAA